LSSLLPPELSQLVYVVDENLLRLGRALVALRNDVGCFGQPPLNEVLPSGIGDTEWIPVVGSCGWIAITSDRRLRTRPTEARLALEYRLKVVHLHGDVGHRSSWEQAERLISRWRTLERQRSTSPAGPWWLSLRSDSSRVLAFEPGQVERGR
jgi:hypothetical protein